MRWRGSIWLAALGMLSGLAGCGARGAEITLVPYYGDESGFAGVVPAGWVEFSPGHFQPAVPSTEPTLFAQLDLSDWTVEQVLEVVSLPDRVGSLETEKGLTWRLYAGDFPVPGVATIVWEVALAEAGSGAYVTVLATQAAEHEVLREALFLPSLEALDPSTDGMPAAERRTQPTQEMPQVGGPAPIDSQVRHRDGMVMVLVPAGGFEMGSNAIWRWSGQLQDGTLSVHPFPDQSPQHTVYLDAFWIDQTEVTVAMFRAFVEATGYVTTAEREGHGHPYRPGPKEEEWPDVPGANWQHPGGLDSDAKDDHPVVQVSWHDAAAYCAWVGGSLPTEAQWEKACRGSDQRQYPWGSGFDEQCANHCDSQCPVERWADASYNDGYGQTAPVGSYPEGASPYGALDMAGNVWEWTADWYDRQYYSDSPGRNPQGPEVGDARVQHGGAWIDAGSAGWLTCTVRHATPPQTRCDDLGFRCAVPLEGPQGG